jgi:hypothetical protein
MIFIYRAEHNAKRIKRDALLHTNNEDCEEVNRRQNQVLALSLHPIARQNYEEMI